MRVLVVDKNQKPLMPCRAARARELLTQKKAAVFRRYPFTIILLVREGGDCQPIELKIDPGSKTTGIALVVQSKNGQKAVWAAHLHHRGLSIKSALETRRANRRSRRFRHTRYRKPRFDNRTRGKKWLAPSLGSRVKNVVCWARRLRLWAPVLLISIEAVRFDSQKLQNPEITGVEYQQGTLHGYEVREYLLEKWERACAYCGQRDTRLEIDHIVPRSSNGSNRVSNLTITCRGCNQKKSNQTLREFLVNNKEALARITRLSQLPLRDAAAVNTTRIAIGEGLKSLGLPITSWSGAQTKYNRSLQRYEKEHWIDAACVGNSGEHVSLSDIETILEIRSIGRGSRQMCKVDRFGFQRGSPKKQKRVFGFQTGDMVRAIVPTGKKKGTYMGKVAIRSTGNFNIKTSAQIVQGINVKFCSRLHQLDGYEYKNQKRERRFLHILKDVVSALSLK